MIGIGVVDVVVKTFETGVVAMEKVGEEVEKAK